jgi:hypothetical protein
MKDFERFDRVFLKLRRLLPPQTAYKLAVVIVSR